jgi:hypothetical protein
MRERYPTYGLIHDANHYITENAELEEVPEFHTEVKRLQDILLAKVKNQRDAPNKNTSDYILSFLT